MIVPTRQLHFPGEPGLEASDVEVDRFQKTVLDAELAEERDLAHGISFPERLFPRPPRGVVQGVVFASNGMSHFQTDIRYIIRGHIWQGKLGRDWKLGAYAPDRDFEDRPQ
jgi:hypothetical protein